MHRNAAQSKSPLETLLKISRESVLVLPEILPPSIMVIPTSPEALANPRSNPAKSVFEQRGIEKLAARTDKNDINPHDSHLENLDCGACHHGHKKPVLACDECHEFTNIKVP